MNLYKLPEFLPDEELSEVLLKGQNIIIERIISTGQVSPEGFWYNQEQDEWVAVLQGRAKIAWEDGQILCMGPGDAVMIPAHKRHRIEWTSRNPACIWLAVHGKLR